MTRRLPLWILVPFAFQGPVQAKDMVSSVLEGRRVSYLVCELVNKTGGNLDGVELTLKDPAGDPVAGPFACPTLADAETCSLEYAIAFPDLDVAAYCHATLPEAFVRGGLRLLDISRKTLAQSDLEPNLHGKIAALEAKIDAQFEMLTMLVAPPLVIAYIDQDDDDNFDDADRVIAKLLDVDRDGAASAGDLFVPGAYPLAFSGLVVDTFQAGPFFCSSASGSTLSAVCETSFGSVNFASTSGGEVFATFDVNASTIDRITDGAGTGGMDRVLTPTASPLQPATPAALGPVPSTTDDAFFELDFFVSP